MLAVQKLIPDFSSTKNPPARERRRAPPWITPRGTGAERQRHEPYGEFCPSQYSEWAKFGLMRLKSPEMLMRYERLVPQKHLRSATLSLDKQLPVWPVAQQQNLGPTPEAELRGQAVVEAACPAPLI